MTFLLGIAVGADRIRAVALKGGRIVAATEAEVGPGDSLSVAVAELLSAAPLPRYPRPRVVVALGPSLSQTRRIAGLPPLDDARQEYDALFVAIGLVAASGAVLVTGSVVTVTRPSSSTGCAASQSVGMPSSLEYWHIGETTSRFFNSTDRIFNGWNKFDIVCIFTQTSDHYLFCLKFYCGTLNNWPYI